jgi:hypothetical protein
VNTRVLYVLSYILKTMWQRVEHTLFVTGNLINLAVDVNVSDAPLHKKHNDLQKKVWEIFLLQ